MNKKLALALSTTFLVPFVALADDDEFGISHEPVASPARTYLNHLELGAGYSSDNPLQARPYSGRHDDGVFPVGSLSLLYRTPYDVNGADFLRVKGASFGYDSRRLSVEGGEQGLYKLNFGYELGPFSNFRGLSAWTNEGGDQLIRVPDWNNLNGTNSANRALRHPVDIRTERERFSSGVTWHIDPEYSVRMGARTERKEGLRPLGVFTGTSPVQVPAPINYQDDRVEAELGYAGKKAQWRLGYNLSLFQNGDSTLTIDRPNSSTLRDRMSLAPSNTAHSAYADGGYQFTDTTRLTTNLSYSQYLQDDTFLPYSLNQTTNFRDLPRQSLDGRISTTTANVELTTRPLSKLDTKTRYRFTNRRNDTDVSEFIYVPNDGPGTNADTNAGSNRRRRNTPYSFQENLASLDLGYALTPRTKLLSGYEFRAFERSHSERAKNIDNTGYMGVRSALAEGLTGNAKYSRMWRDGSTYSPTGSLVYTNTGPYISGNNIWDNNPLLRKFHEADLIRDRLQAGVNYMPLEGLTFGLSGGFLVDEYVRSELGLTDSVATNATLDASWVASPALTLTGFYTYERRVTDQAGQQAATPELSDSTRRWWVNIAEDAHTAGVGSVWQIREGLRLLTDYAFIWTITETDPTRGTETVAGMAPAASFPDITSKTHTISARAEYDLTENVVIGLGYAFEMYRSKDWAYQPVNETSGSLMTMTNTEPNYNAHLFLVTTRAKF